MQTTIVMQAVVFAFAAWLGAYLIRRDPRKPMLVYTGLGLLTYAAGLALNALMTASPSPAITLSLQRIRWPLLFIPALCWLGAAIDLLPEGMRLRGILSRGWRALLPLIVAVLYGLNAVVTMQVGSTLYTLFANLTGAALVAAVVLVIWSFRSARPRRLLALILLTGLFLTLSVSFMLFPAIMISRETMLLMVGLDLAVLGLVIGLLDAFEEGEALLPDMLLSLAQTGLLTLAVGGQVALALVSGPASYSLVLLLFGVSGTAVIAAVYASTFQAAIDRLVLPRLRRTRADLRAASDALPRAAAQPDLAALPEADFIRLTRRALSHLNDPGKLATSPLMGLPQIDARLRGRGAGDFALERARELRALLVESIERLKPVNAGAPVVSDAWRHYNVLYYPYVLGVKSAHAPNAALDPGTAAVLKWLRADVPERTLYHWQNAAARLVAQDLRDQLRGNGSVLQ